MDYCLNIDTNKFKKINKINNYNYNFLNNLNKYDINIDIYYDILNSYESYKIKNIYNYIYNRINKLEIENTKFIKNDINLTSDEFNNLLNQYIDNELKSIVILNSIQQYYKPVFN